MMVNEAIKAKYELWQERATDDDDLREELEEIKGQDNLIEDAFYCDLKFGTGGLRGVLGAGTNRMNIYTVRKASQGVANYVIRHFAEDQRVIAISYDSRIKSERFAKEAASVFAANEIKVMIYSELMPTPCLSFAVRALHCVAGIMITASHNPAKYNGYKVYGADGCQITTEVAQAIQHEIDSLDEFVVSDNMRPHRAIEDKVQVIPSEVYDEFCKSVRQQSLIAVDSHINREIKIVYTPLNGTGFKPVLRVLREEGFTNVDVVQEQALPDGNFPTCPYPNPENKEAMTLGIECARQNGAELVLATDPDCDRVGIAVKGTNGDYHLFSGNETGILLLDYICSKRVQRGTMPSHPVFIKTIVTTDMATEIANHYGLQTIEVLTGFKYIGEQIGLLEQNGRALDYVFGFEESYGYLSGTYVRDKDAVNASLLICEMYADYRAQGISLAEKLEELYRLYGYTKNTLQSYWFEGIEGKHKIQKIMSDFRKIESDFGGNKIISKIDYSIGVDCLPKSDVLKLILQNNCSLVIRPSGTEPKLKIYVSATGRTEGEAERRKTLLLQKVKNVCE